MNIIQDANFQPGADLEGVEEVRVVLANVGLLLGNDLLEGGNLLTQRSAGLVHVPYCRLRHKEQLACLLCTPITAHNSSASATSTACKKRSRAV